jgi:predicted short-subunit dehydrogenase-like oxidoreductase (DUF2520 family)
MRQVPAGDAAPIGVVGDGRLARHFLHYLSLLGRPAIAWSRRQHAADPPQTFAPCRTIVVLLRDDAIVPFVDAWPALRDKQLVHCAGSLLTDVAQCAHPLMTFSESLYDLATYTRVPFIVEIGGTPFDALLPGLPNPSFAIPAADRPYYHALCVMAGNFSTLLWRKLFDELQDRFDIPATAAQGYLAQITAGLMSDPGRALTGPLSRGDLATIAANLRALEGDRFHQVYEAFVRAYESRA